MLYGKIHSFESMGLVDGPGIRSVVFMQGCSLRCSYCHNPDTWPLCGGKTISSKELVDKLYRFKTYYDTSGGGVTFSGGEPLLQPDFLIECLKLCKEKNIHTTIDTAGCGIGKYEEILKYTDLVLLDIKHIDDHNFKLLTGKDSKESLKFINVLNSLNIPVWIRHVVVPGITNSEEHILKLSNILKTKINNIKKVNLLPYHTLGIKKYKSLGIKYKLENTKPMDKDKCSKLEELLKKELES